MILKHQKFNHDHKTFDTSLNIDKDVQIIVREKILFASLFNYIKGKEIMKNEGMTDPRELPSNYSSTSGDLEKCLSIIDDEMEYAYMLLTFNKTTEIVKGSVMQYGFINGDGVPEDLKQKAKEILQKHESKFLEEIKNKIDKTDYHLLSLIPQNMFKRIDMIKHHNCEWEPYLKDLQIKNFFNSIDSKDNFADDVLQSIFDSEK